MRKRRGDVDAVGYWYADRYLDAGRRELGGAGYSILPPRHAVTAEQLFCWSVIEDALMTLRLDGRTQALDTGEDPATLVAETRAWIADDTDDAWLCRFATCCRVLGFEPDYVRRLIAEAERCDDWLLGRKPCIRAAAGRPGRKPRQKVEPRHRNAI